MMSRMMLPAFVLLMVLAFGSVIAVAQSIDDDTLHPPILLLDNDGNNVLETVQAIDAMTTCATCHDSEFISNHSVHSDAGLSTIGGGGYTSRLAGWHRLVWWLGPDYIQHC